jgi:hypothetical protein
MNQYLLYAIILLCILILIIYINKKYNLEGYTYTYNKNLSFNKGRPIVTHNDPNNNVTESSCKMQCDLLPNCTGFTSNINSGSNIPGNCTYYSHQKNDTEHVQGTNLYLKQI